MADDDSTGGAAGDRRGSGDPRGSDVGSGRVSGTVDPLVIVGPTASGKSALAMGIARRLATIGAVVEIVSGDSMQVYRGMDIGTAKPTGAERSIVPHHLIDVVDPTEEFSVARFVDLASAAIDTIRARGHLPVVVGGTGLYIQSLVDRSRIPGRYPDVRESLEAQNDTAHLYDRLVALDPVAATRMEPTNRRRIIRALEVTLGSGEPFSTYGPGMDTYPPTSWTLVGVDLDREVLTDRIRRRFHQQLDAGFLGEVAALMDPAREVPISRTAAQALGYKELAEHLSGSVDLDAAVDEAIRRTRRFAIRQIRWFRRDPRIRWFTYNDDPTEMTEAVVTHWLPGSGEVGDSIGSSDERRSGDGPWMDGNS